MVNLPIAFLTAITPLIGGLCVMCISDKHIINIKASSIWTSCYTLYLALTTLCSFDASTGKYVEEIGTLGATHGKLTIVVDELSAVVVPVICFICLLSRVWTLGTDVRMMKAQFVMLFFFEAFAILAFYMTDIFLLFICMEATTIPIYTIMSTRAPPTHDAVFRFLIYTIVGALLILVALIMIYLETHTSDLYEIYNGGGVKGRVAFLLLILGIAIKMPMWPFYHWLPVVHVKSQTTCSVILAAVTLKFASLLIVRFVEPLFLSELMTNSVIVSCVSIVSIVYALSQLVFQDDIKRMFAYFSIIHLNMYLLILLSGLSKGYFIFAIIQHSITVAALFFAADVVKKSCGTRLISELKNISNIPPFTRRIMIAAFLLLISVPFSCGFICEIISVYAAWNISIVLTVAVLASIMISSIYAIYVYHICFGRRTAQEQPSEYAKHNVGAAQKSVLLSLVAVALLLGIMPDLVLRIF
jgi:NADH-quinone oxidoreductase subunit M